VSKLSPIIAAEPAPAPYGVIVQRDCGDGWFEAETQLSRLHPVQFGTGRDPASALAVLRQRLKVWEY
jgi:hypothetical protein